MCSAISDSLVRNHCQGNFRSSFSVSSILGSRTFLPGPRQSNPRSPESVRKPLGALRKTDSSSYDTGDSSVLGMRPPSKLDWGDRDDEKLPSQDSGPSMDLMDLIRSIDRSFVRDGSIDDWFREVGLETAIMMPNPRPKPSYQGHCRFETQNRGSTRLMRDAVLS